MQNQTSPVLLFLSGGRDSQAVACRTPKRVAKCGFCLSLGNPLRRSCVSDGQTCGVVKCETSLAAATVCGDRAFRNVNFFWARATFCRDCAGRTSKHVPKCKFGGPALPLRTKRGSTVKNWCKIVILKVPMQVWHESQTAITGWENWDFLTSVRCKRSRIRVKLRLYLFWNVRHNRFARNKTYVELRFYKVRRNPFTQNDCPTSIAIFQRRMQPFRTDGRTSKLT